MYRYVSTNTHTHTQLYICVSACILEFQFLTIKEYILAYAAEQVGRVAADMC